MALTTSAASPSLRKRARAALRAPLSRGSQFHAKMRPETSTDFDQTIIEPGKFELGPLGSLNQVIKALGKTIRAMADGSIDSQVGARICNGLGIMRTCLEAQKLEHLESRMDQIANQVTRYEVDRHTH